MGSEASKKKICNGIIDQFDITRGPQPETYAPRPRMSEPTSAPFEDTHCIDLKNLKMTCFFFSEHIRVVLCLKVHGEGDSLGVKVAGVMLIRCCFLTLYEWF